MKISRRLTMCSRSGRDSRKEPFRQLPSMPTLRLQGRWLDVRWPGSHGHGRLEEFQSI